MSRIGNKRNTLINDSLKCSPFKKSSSLEIWNNVKKLIDKEIVKDLKKCEEVPNIKLQSK